MQKGSCWTKECLALGLSVPYPSSHNFHQTSVSIFKQHAIKIKNICQLYRSILKRSQKQTVVPKTSQTEVSALPLGTQSYDYDFHMLFLRISPPQSPEFMSLCSGKRYDNVPGSLTIAKISFHLILEPARKTKRLGIFCSFQSLQSGCKKVEKVTLWKRSSFH